MRLNDSERGKGQANMQDKGTALYTARIRLLSLRLFADYAHLKAFDVHDDLKQIRLY